MPRVGKQTSKTKKSFPRNRSDEDFTACVWTVTSLNKCNLNCTQKQMLGVWVRYRFNDFDGKISLNQLFILIFSTLTLKGGFKEASWSLKIYIFVARAGSTSSGVLGQNWTLGPHWPPQGWYALLHYIMDYEHAPRLWQHICGNFRYTFIRKCK